MLPNDARFACNNVFLARFWGHGNKQTSYKYRDRRDLYGWRAGSGLFLPKIRQVLGVLDTAIILRDIT